MNVRFSKIVITVLVLGFGLFFLKQFGSVLTLASSEHPPSGLPDAATVSPKDLFQLLPPTDTKICNDGIDKFHSLNAKNRLLPKVLQRSCFKFDSKKFLAVLKDRPITLRLFDNTSVEFHPDRYELVPRLPKKKAPLGQHNGPDAASVRYRWTGRIASHNSVDGIGTFIINESRQTILGTIRYGRTLIRYQPLKDNLHAILEIDLTGFPDEADPNKLSGQAQRTLKSQNKTPASPSSRQVMARSFQTDDCTSNDAAPYTIDVLAFYTHEARIGAGDSEELVESEILEAIDHANKVLEKNETPLRFNPVGLEPVSYSDSGALQSDLDALTGTEAEEPPEDRPSLSKMATELRESSKADLVSLFVGDGDSCGIGQQNSWSNLSPELAYSVVVRTCIGNLSMLHEQGHNMGAGHDSSSNTSNLAHGHKSQADKRRTIMAKKVTCPDCTRVPFWSSPDHMYPDTTTKRGNSSANNTQALRTTACQVSKFR